MERISFRYLALLTGSISFLWLSCSPPVEAFPSIHVSQAVNQRQITIFYREILERDVDQSGNDTWMGAIRNGWSLDRVRRAIAESPEAQNKIRDVYKTMLCRDADPSGLSTWTNALATGWSLSRVRYEGIAGSQEYLSRGGKPCQLISPPPSTIIPPASSTIIPPASMPQSGSSINACNQDPSKTIYTALVVYNQTQGWQSRGWYQVNSQQCTSIDLGSYTGSVYIYGQYNGGESSWGGTDGVFCINQVNAFNIPYSDTDACNGNNSKKVSMTRLTINPGQNTWNMSATSASTSTEKPCALQIGGVCVIK